MTAENTPTPAGPDTIVLFHGLWGHPRSQEKWVERYEGRGYRVLAPAYPGFEVEVALDWAVEHAKRPSGMTAQLAKLRRLPRSRKTRARSINLVLTPLLS